LYIDGVFAGGGIKGFALVGALQAVENKGLIYRRLAGTSAGAIISAFIVAGYTSRDIQKMLEEMELSDLLDSRASLLPAKWGKWLLLYWRLGLYKGDRLELWIEEKLKARGIYSFGDVPKHALRIIASDITDGKIVVIPDDLPSYGIKPETFSVAKAVRMSCSLPYFFEPVKLKANSGVKIIVDGGVLSNFPMWLFQKRDQPKVRPVLGVKFSSPEESVQSTEIHNAIDLFGALFDTMKNAHDARHISKKHERDIIFLPVDSTLTTEFGLTEEKKEELISLGRERANAFLKTWTY
jgi:NTE family protein